VNIFSQQAKCYTFSELYPLNPDDMHANECKTSKEYRPHRGAIKGRETEREAMRSSMLRGAHPPSHKVLGLFPRRHQHAMQPLAPRWSEALGADTQVGDGRDAICPA